MTTGLLSDDRFLDHDPGEGHPESPRRYQASIRHLKSLDWFGSLKPFQPRDAGEAWLHAVHAPEYVRRAREACRAGDPWLDTPDVVLSEKSWETACLAAGAGLELADRMMAGEIRNGFALLRPPGHHAESAQAMGFCLFNNIAVLARYLQKRHGLEKILILDWDVHHGNGTQHTFEEAADVFYMSLHQYPFYPGTGAFHERGAGRGKGYTLNCPMPAGAWDADYRSAFQEHILPKAREYRPDAVLISAGFDAHFSDPLAQVQLSTEMYGWMTARMLEIAEDFAKGRILSLLEGGYNLEYLPRCVEQHLAVLAGRGGG